jgi:hypothetical protein
MWGTSEPGKVTAGRDGDMALCAELVNAPRQQLVRWAPDPERVHKGVLFMTHIDPTELHDADLKSARPWRLPRRSPSAGDGRLQARA